MNTAITHQEREALYAAMDETMEFRVSPAARDQLSDGAIELLTDEADKAAAAAMLEDMKAILRRKFIVAVANVSAANTPKVPTTWSLNVAEEHEAKDRFEHRVVMKPITAVLHSYLDTHGETDEVLETYIASAEHLLAVRNRHIANIAAQYVEAEAATLIAAGWAE